jgi:competence CoiA-like predicted nuclease
MLVARNKLNDEIVYSYQCDADYLKKLSKEKELVCQECSRPMIFKRGKVKVAHFAHRQCECTYVYWENESANHMRAKIEIKAKLELLYPNSNVYIEYKVEETQQRSDIMIIHPDGERWAFEIQLSRITIGELLERRKLYLKAGVLDFWLMGYDYSKSISFSVWEESEIFNSELNTLTIGETILINNISLSTMVFKKTNSVIKIFDSNVLSIAADSYFKAKEALYNTLKNRYYSSTVIKDAPIGNDGEKADVLMVSKNGTKFAINLLYKNYHDILLENSAGDYLSQRLLCYEKAGVNLFWVNGVYKVDCNSYSFSGYGGYGYESHGYYLEEKEGSYFIKNDYYREYYSEFPIENITINKINPGDTYLLEDAVKVNEFNSYKRDRYIEYKEKCPKCNTTLRLKRQFSYPIFYCNCGYTKNVEYLNCPSCRSEMKFKYSKFNFRSYWMCKDYPSCNTTIDARIDSRK